MRAEDQRMMTILYAPASYTHQSHLPEIFRETAIRQDNLLNFWLLRRGKLSDLPCDWQSNDAVLSLLLARWPLIPVTAQLIGSHLLRSQVLEHGAVLMSDPRLLAFVSLPLLYEVTFKPANPPPDTLSCGAGFIMSQFPELPAALRQRLWLHFPNTLALPELSAPKTLNNINLLRMALNHAYYYY